MGQPLFMGYGATRIRWNNLPDDENALNEMVSRPYILYCKTIFFLLAHWHADILAVLDATTATTAVLDARTAREHYVVEFAPKLSAQLVRKFLADQVQFFQMPEYIIIINVCWRKCKIAFRDYCLGVGVSFFGKP
jgi:hypothetical protein